jgi:predicted CoA-binding protein
MAEISSLKRVAILGASPKPDRYSYRALRMLQEYGHDAVPVNPGYDQILGAKCYPSLSDVPGRLDTITVYLGKRRSDPLIQQITDASPRRIILNPGAENDQLAAEAQRHGIEVVEGCTLVMLTVGSF